MLPEKIFLRKKGGFMAEYTETIKIRVTQEMKTDLEMIAYRKGFGFSECVRELLQEAIDNEDVPLPFGDAESEE